MLTFGGVSFEAIALKNLRRRMTCISSLAPYLLQGDYAFIFEYFSLR